MFCRGLARDRTGRVAAPSTGRSKHRQLSAGTLKILIELIGALQPANHNINQELCKQLLWPVSVPIPNMSCNG